MQVLSVNVAHVRDNPWQRGPESTGIDKRPADRPVEVRAPGPQRTGLGSGLVGDVIGERDVHGGDNQAVYAYAREDLDWWQVELGRELPGGCFGENLTTVGIDVTGARIGERWQIGPDVVLQVTDPRIPCATFAGWLAEKGWQKTFMVAARPGAYLRVVQPGRISAGDELTVVRRPDHDVTIGVVFRALTLEPELLPRLLTADDVPEQTQDRARRRVTA